MQPIRVSGNIRTMPTFLPRLPDDWSSNGLAISPQAKAYEPSGIGLLSAAIERRPRTRPAINEKARRGRRCGRLFEKNRTATGRRSAAVPTDVPWEEEWAV